MNQCPHCGSPIPEPTEVGAPSPSSCPSCGQQLVAPPSPWETATAPIRHYFRDIWTIAFQPGVFFRKMSVRGGVSYPLAFALVTHWLGSALEYLWRQGIGHTFIDSISGLFQIAGDVADVDSPGRSEMMFQIRDRILHWFWGAGSVIADPFITLFSILFTSFFVFIGARILVSPGKNGAPEEITYESALRIVCFGMSPALLQGIPLAGPLIATFWVAVVTIIGAKEVYRIGAGRAIVVALFPKILFLGTVLLGLSIFAIALIKLVTSFFY